MFLISGKLIPVIYRVSFLSVVYIYFIFQLIRFLFQKFLLSSSSSVVLLIKIIVMKEMRRTTARTTKLRIYRSFLNFAPSLLPKGICVMQTIFEEEILQRFCLTLNKYCQVEKIMEIYDVKHSNNLRLIQTFNITKRQSKRLQSSNVALGKRDKKERSKETALCAGRNLFQGRADRGKFRSICS